MMNVRFLIFWLALLSANIWAQGPVYQVGVDGLACPFCAYGIEKQLQKLDGVAQVETEIKQGIVVIRVKEGKTLDQLQVEKAVKKAGFSLRSFQQAEAATP